jgi:hypothetical protein
MSDSRLRCIDSPAVRRVCLGGQAVDRVAGGRQTVDKENPGGRMVRCRMLAGRSAVVSTCTQIGSADSSVQGRQASALTEDFSARSWRNRG